MSETSINFLLHHLSTLFRLTFNSNYGEVPKTHKVVQYFYTMFPSVECVRGHDDMVPFIVSGKNTYCWDHHFLLLIASSGLRA
jgi:hypothetical protein